MAESNNDRPYINLLTKDFRSEVEKNSANPEELRKLKLEIGYRKKAKEKLRPLIKVDEVRKPQVVSTAMALVFLRPAQRWSHWIFLVLVNLCIETSSVNKIPISRTGAVLLYLLVER